MIRRLRTDLAAGLGLFTRLPVGWLMPRHASVDMAGCVWTFPIAGGLLGLCGGLGYAIAARLGLPPALSACWSLAAMLLLGGALHEDGLADMADGFGGGGDAAGKLAIMRDSRIGSYGALALALSSLARIAAVTAIAAPWRVCAALAASGALSRTSIVLVLVLLAPARRDGLASSLHPLPPVPALAGIAAGLGASALLLPASAVLAAGLAALSVSLLVAWLARRQIGGHTGDVLGACSVLAECVLLSTLCAR